MSFSRSGSLAALVVAGGCSAVSAPTFPRAEIDAYESSIKAPGLRDLHDEKGPWLDGVKGRWSGRVISDGVYTDLPPGVANEIERRFYTTWCAVPLIAVATAAGEQAYLIDAKRSIVTATRFRLDDVIKAPTGVGAGSIVDMIRPGGEVVDDGELLRLTADDAGTPFASSQRYLLIAQQRGPLSGTNAYTTGIAIRVAFGMLYPEGVPQRGSPVDHNMPLAWFRTRLAEIAAKAPCVANGKPVPVPSGVPNER